jgi:hypothetical protein
VRTYVPEKLKGTTFLIEDWQWLAGIIVVILLYCLHRIIISLCRWLIVSALAPRLGLPPALNLKPLGRPVAVVVFSLALQLFLLTIDLPVNVYSTAVSWLSTAWIVALVVLVTGPFLRSETGFFMSAWDSFIACIFDPLWQAITKSYLFHTVVAYINVIPSSNNFFGAQAWISSFDL